jgi:hypothetical protein
MRLIIRKPTVLLREQGMLILDTTESHLILDARFIIHAMNAVWL